MGGGVDATEGGLSTTKRLREWSCLENRPSLDPSNICCSQKDLLGLSKNQYITFGSIILYISAKSRFTYVKATLATLSRVNVVMHQCILYFYHSTSDISDYLIC